MTAIATAILGDVKLPESEEMHAVVEEERQ